jgi:hypothetical protein
LVTSRAIRFRGVGAAGVSALTVAAALAFPAGAGAATVAYSGQTSPQDFSNDGVDNATPEPFSFDFDGASITNVQTGTSLRCPDDSYMNMGTLPGMPGEPFQVTGGHFDATIGNPNEGHGVTWHLVGDIASGKASGTAEVQAHEYSGVTPSGPVCTSSFSWTASTSTSAPTEPTPTDPTPGPTAPTPPRLELTPKTLQRGPAASLIILALRSPDHHFFWGTASVSCQNRATNLVFTVRRNHRLLSRRRLGCRRRISLASSAVKPHRKYAIRVQPVRIRKGRIVARGEAYAVRLYMPGNEANWVPIPAPASRWP